MVFILAMLLSSPLFAQDNSVDGQTMNITYGSPSWNTDSRKIDSAYLVMRDKASGRTVQIQLEETEPDSSQFTGKFNVTLSDTNPQVFIPPKELRNPERDYKRVFQMIQSGQLTSKPIVWKKNDKGQTLVDVYDTQEQADAVAKAYQEQQRLQAFERQQRLLKEVQAKEAAAAAKAAEQKALMEKLALDAAKREANRVRLEQIEIQKAAERERQARLLSEQQRFERRAKAKQLSEEAMVLFNQGEFDSAEVKFRQSLELDPEDKSYYFKYGVTLFKVGKLNEALVTLKMAQVEPSLELEKEYFTGLVHYRLKEYKSAKERFAKASVSPDSIIGPSSLFYLGMVQYSDEEYEPAKASFEKVLDTSKDPRMDRQAEEYIEKIMRALQFKKLQEKRWTVAGTLGLMYDSNVTLSPDTTSTQATDKADARALTAADITYRAVYTPKHDFSIKSGANLTNSAKSAVATADPYFLSFSTPYSYNSTAFGKGWVLSLKPGHDLLYMDPTSTGKKSKILGSTSLGVDNMFVMNPTWIAVYTFEARQDAFDIPGSTQGDDNFDATKYTLKTTQMVFMDKARKEALVAGLGYSLNNAKGKNKTFNRIEASVIYLKPMKWGYALNTGLTVFNLDYNKSNDKRKDTNVMFSLGLDKPVKEWMSWGVMGAYTKNDSTNESTYEYSKWLVMTTATFRTNF